ncbi:MAG TPA: hypothetical protein VNS32_09875, partial [Flavisolibacter sp.]|nr:hypothetical protein [Flavisolibacter sp.]
MNYSTLLNGVSVNAIQSFRNVALTDAPRNYVDLNFPLMAWIGPFYFSAPLSGELNMPGGGKLKYTAKSSDIPSSGFWSAGGLFMDPKALGFAITNPDFSVDVSGKRWYMRPWGIMGLSLKLPFVASGGAQLVFPIPKELRTIAPDSIETWNYTNQHWVYKGYALKSDTNYIKKIDNDGLWSFGIHQKGVYKTFRLRTPEGIPLPNALIRITDSFGELGAARSDVDGNAVLFLPIGESMNLELLPYWSAANFPRDKVLTQPIAPFDANADITITVPDTSPYLATVKGTAKTCNGDAIKNGTVRITFNDSTPFFHIPVRNGLFQAALINSGPPRYRVFLINDDTGESDRDTAVYTEIGKTTLLYLNTCHKPTNTFVHYSMDGISYSIEGDALHPESPALNAYTSIAGPYHTLFSCAKNPGAGGEKFQFETSVTNTGNYTGSGFNAIY